MFAADALVPKLIKAFDVIEMCYKAFFDIH